MERYERDLGKKLRAVPIADRAGTLIIMKGGKRRMMLSIIVPVYNAEKYLRQCIDSILCQSYGDFELLLADDGSDDGSMAICREYEKKDRRVRIIVGSHKGPYFARKLGVESAKGDYITFVDADDFIAEDAYRMAEADMGSAIDIISFGISRYVDVGDIRHTESSIADGRYDRQGIEEKIFPRMIWDESRNRWGIDPSLCIKLYKAGLLKELYRDLPEVHFHYGEDMAVVYPLIGRAESLSIHQEIYYFHRQRPRGMIAPYIKEERYFDRLYELYRHLSESMRFNNIFQRQIDLLYLHSVELAKRKYGLPVSPAEAIFPFDRVEKGGKIVIYGAGDLGKLYVRQLGKLEYCDVVLWADRNHAQLPGRVCAPEEILKTDYDKIVIAIVDPNVRRQAVESLVELGISREDMV